MSFIKLLLVQLGIKLIRYYFRVDFIIALVLCKTRRYVLKSKSKLDDLIWRQGYKGATEEGIKVSCEDLE